MVFANQVPLAIQQVGKQLARQNKFTSSSIDTANLTVGLGNAASYFNTDLAPTTLRSQRCFKSAAIHWLVNLESMMRKYVQERGYSEPIFKHSYDTFEVGWSSYPGFAEMNCANSTDVVQTKMYKNSKLCCSAREHRRIQHAKATSKLRSLDELGSLGSGLHALKPHPSSVCKACRSYDAGKYNFKHFKLVGQEKQLFQSKILLFVRPFSFDRRLSYLFRIMSPFAPPCQDCREKLASWSARSQDRTTKAGRLAILAPLILYTAAKHGSHKINRALVSVHHWKL